VRGAFISVISVLFPLALAAVGVLLLVSPASFVRLCALIGQPGIQLRSRWSDPDEVNRSLAMRVEWRIAGAAFLLIAFAVAWDEFSRS